VEKKQTWHERNREKLREYYKLYYSRPDVRERQNRRRREKYAQDSSRWKAANRRNRERLKRYVWEQKSVPCKDCGQTFEPYVMHFDHRDPATKKYNVGKMYMSCNSLSKIKEEIAKCDVVCANCHAMRTYKQNVTGYFQKGWHPRVQA